jgi:hypothetical protein
MRGFFKSLLGMPFLFPRQFDSLFTAQDLGVFPKESADARHNETMTALRQNGVPSEIPQLRCPFRSKVGARIGRSSQTGQLASPKILHCWRGLVAKRTYEEVVTNGY